MKLSRHGGGLHIEEGTETKKEEPRISSTESNRPDGDDYYSTCPWLYRV
ncbi:MAG: hypothetical protein ACPGXX_20035 [Planctomycetaceae bacterium]